MIGEYRQKRLHAIKQGKGGEAGEKQAETDAAIGGSAGQNPANGGLRAVFHE